MGFWSQKARTHFGETLYTTTNLESNDSHWTKYDNFLFKFKMAFYAPGRLMRSTVAATFGWSNGIASANTATAKPWPLPANRTVSILLLWGGEIEHVHNFDETWVSLCHVVQENEKPGRKTENINTTKLEVLSLSRPIVH